MLLAHSCSTPFDNLKSRFSFLLADSTAHTFFFPLPQVPCLSHAGPITGKRPVIIIALSVYWCKFAIVTSKRRQGRYKTKPFEASVRRFIGRQRIKSTHSDPQCDARMRSPHPCATLPLKNEEAHRIGDKEFNLIFPSISSQFMTAKVFHTCVWRASFEYPSNVLDSINRRAG